MKHRFLALIIAFVASVQFLFAAGDTSSKDWPAYRHDANRTAVSATPLPGKLHSQWTWQSTHAPIPAWPMPGEEQPRMHTDRAFHVSVVGETAFFGSSADNKLRALNTRTGAERWSFFAEGAIRFAPHVANGKVYFGSDDGYAYCLNAADGKQVWRYQPNPATERVIGNGRMISLWPLRTGLLVDKDIVYLAAGIFPYEGLYVCAIDANTGREIWKNDTAGDLSWELQYGGMAPQGYLIASENTLYVPSGRAMPAAFDRKTGKFQSFLSGGGKAGGTWALIDNGRLIAGDNNRGAPTKIVFDDKTKRSKGDIFASFPGIDMALTTETAYTLTETAIVAINRKAYQAAAGELPKIAAKRKTVTKQIADTRAAMKAASKKGEDTKAATTKLAALTKEISDLSKREKELAASRIKWTFSHSGLKTIALAGNTVISGGKGVIQSINATTGKSEWQAKIDGQVIGTSVGDDRLFVSSTTGAIYCFGSKPVGQPRIVNDVREGTGLEPAGYKQAAKEILKQSGVTKGFCLVIDAGTGNLARHLAELSELKIIGIEHDPEKRRVARYRLEAAGLYGSRVVIEGWSYGELPDYFANLIVSDRVATGGSTSASKTELERILRPAGGVAIFAHSDKTAAAPNLGDGKWPSEVTDGKLPTIKYTRPKLEKSGSWSGLYGNGGNTGSSPDELVKGPMGVLWFGEPGSEHMLDRHARSVSPIAINGRLLVQGMEVVMGYDAYNGTFLWKRDIKGAVRSRVDVDGSNLSATDDHLFVGAIDSALQLDAQTGKTIREFAVPPHSSGQARRWGYISATKDTLYGSSAIPLKAEYGSMWNDMVENGEWKADDQIPEFFKKFKARGSQDSLVTYFKKKYARPDFNALSEFKRDGYHWKYSTKFPGWLPDHKPSAVDDRMMISDSLFAYDAKTGKLLWKHESTKIPQISIAIGDGKIFFVQDDLTAEDRKAAKAERKALIETDVYKPHDEDKLPENKKDYRRVVALDARTGKQIWSKPVDLSGSGGNKLGVAYADGKLLFFGHYSNHDQSAFVKGDLEWRRVTVMDGEGGSFLWSKPLNYRRRPLIMNQTLFIEPRAANLADGTIKNRTHPITGAQVPWEFLRPGHSCGIVTAAPNSIFYRSYSAALVNVEKDTGLQLFGGTRPGCWNSMIPANGLLTMQESSAGCTCSYSLRTTITLKHKPQKEPGEWTVFISDQPTLPVSHMAINLGAPGDMRDPNGTLWFGYPRPVTSVGQGTFRNYGVKFDLGENKDSIVERRDFRGVTIAGDKRSWLYTSALTGLQSMKIPLLEDDKKGVYKIRMGFVAEAGDKAGTRIFDILLNGKSVAGNVDPFATAGKAGKAVVKEFSGVKVTGTLDVGLLSMTGDKGPAMQFIEIIREDIPPTKVTKLNIID